MKEIQFNIDIGDLNTKLKRAEKFPSAGDKVKMVMHSRVGNAAKRPSLEKFTGIIGQIVEFGAQVESPMKFMVTEPSRFLHLIKRLL